MPRKKHTPHKKRFSVSEEVSHCANYLTLQNELENLGMGARKCIFIVFTNSRAAFNSSMTVSESAGMVDVRGGCHRA